MPFDCTSLSLDEGIVAFARFHDEPSLRGLSYALRHRELWPKGFVWDYGDCSTCAIGLAAKLAGFDLFDMDDEFVWLRKTFHIRSTTADAIFDHVHRAPSLRHLGLERRDIQPSHVADAIDRHLKRARG